MRCRHGEDGALARALPQTEARLEVERRMDDAEMGQHGALRPSGRPRGVEDDGGVVLPRVVGGTSGGCEEGLARLGVGGAAVDQDAQSQARQGGSLRQVAGIFALIDQRGGAAIVERGLELGRLQPGAERDGYGAEAQAGDEVDDESPVSMPCRARLPATLRESRSSSP